MSRHTPAGDPNCEIELTRDPHDRHLYRLASIGTIRRDGGMFSTGFIAEAPRHSWRFATRGIMQHRFEATASDGTVVGRFVPKAIKRGGLLEWGEHKLTLHPASFGRESYAVSDSDRDIILVEGKAWGRRPVKLTVDHPDEIESGLVLFAAFVVHRLAINASSMAGSLAAVTASSTSSYS